MGSRHLSGGVVHSCHEASLCSVLCRLSQDTSGPDRGRLEELRHHLESNLRGSWNLSVVSVELLS